MKDSVTLKELAALVIRRGKLCVCLGLVFALLLGGAGMVKAISTINDPNNSPEKIEERYQNNLMQYHEQKTLLTTKLTNAQKHLEIEKSYYEDSLLMQLNPYDVSVTRINLAVTDLEEGTFQQVFEIQGTPVDYIVSRIVNQTLIMWRSADLQTILDKDHMDKYLREVVTLEAQSGGLLAITAYGNTAEESSSLANAAYQYLLDNVEVIAETAYPYQLILLNTSIKNAVYPAWGTLHETKESDLSQCAAQVQQAEAALLNLQEPQREVVLTPKAVAIATAKDMVVGFVLGVFCGAVWVIISYVLGNKLMFGHSLERATGASMLVRFWPKRNLFALLSSCILGERVWQDEKHALEYLKVSAQHRIAQGATVALVTTLRCGEDNHEIQSVMTTLKESGYQVRFINDGYYNADTVAALKSSDAVILAERCGQSATPAIDAVVAWAEEFNKPINGFILI